MSIVGQDSLKTRRTLKVGADSYDYFSLPQPEYYYTFRYGNAQFFMIDSNRPLGPGTPQREWLEKELAALNDLSEITSSSTDPVRLALARAKAAGKSLVRSTRSAWKP